MKKRILALLLAALMVVSLLPMTALANATASVTIEYKGGSQLNIDENFSNLESIGLDSSDWSFNGSKNGYTSYPYFGTNGHLYIRGSSSNGSSVTVTALDGQNILSIELSLATDKSPTVSANDAEVTGEDNSGKMVYSFGEGCTSFTVARGTQNVEITSFKVNYASGIAPQKELVSLAIQGAPTKTEYTVGESFDPTGLTVQATYNDESKADVTDNAAFTVESETFTEAGDNASVKVTAKVGTVTSEEKTINNIKVKAPAPAPTEMTIAKVAVSKNDSEVYVVLDEKDSTTQVNFCIPGDSLESGKTYTLSDMESNYTAIGDKDDWFIWIHITSCEFTPTLDQSGNITSIDASVTTEDGKSYHITYTAPAPAAETVTIYCKCAQSWWNADSAAVGVHYTGGSAETSWPGVRMESLGDNLWKAEIPADSTNVIFTRVNSSGTIADWGAKTKEQSIPQDGKDLFTITTSSAVWGDPGCDGEWSVYSAAPTTYAITNGTPESDAEKNHGYIAIDKKTAAEGETVTITVNPADGYELKSLTVTPEAKTISTIADVLATVEGGFPEGTGMKNPPNNAWVCGSDRYTFVVQSGQNSALIFYYSGYINPSTGTQGNATFVLTTTGVIAGENCYTATSGNNTLTFNMTDGKLTGIVFSSTNEGTQNNYGGTYSTTPPSAEPETITTEKQTDGTYTFTMPGYAVTVTAEFASTYSPETRDEHGIITKPADGEYFVYNRLSSNTSLYLSGSTLYLLYQSGRATMVECADGTVYWQNPISMFTSGAWIKGTREGNTITFPAGQPVIYSKDYDATLSVCWGYFNPNAEDPKDVWTRVDNYQQGNIVFEINGDTLIMQGTSAVKGFNTPFYFPGIFWDDDNSFNGYGDCGVALTYVPSYAIINGTPQAEEVENHGYITVSSEAACEGDFVTVQVWPARNYLLKSLSYQGEGDLEPTTIKRSMLGSFQFQMPAEKITVTAEFEAGPAEFITADTEHPVYDAADFAHYKKGETTWRGYPFVGWFYEDGGTEKEFEGSFAEAKNGMIYTARWKNAAGNYVLTDGITVDANGVYIGEAGIYAATDSMMDRTAPTDCVVSLTAPSGEDKLGVQPSVVPKRINSVLPNDTFAAGADGLGGAASNTELAKYGIRFTPAQNGESAALTLENVSIEAGNGADTYYSYSGGQEIYAGIFSTVPLRLALTGENTVCITRTDAYGCACGIFGGNNVWLKVTGDKLTADASQADGYQTGGIILNGGALTNSATLDGVGGSSSYASYGVSCGYLTNTAGTLTGRAGSGTYCNGVNLTVPSVISGGKVIGYGGAGTGEYYGLWTNQSLNVSDTGVLELHGGTQTGTEIKEALYLENEYATITIAGSGRIVADSTVKNDGAYDDGYTVTGANTDIASGMLNKAGDANIEIFAKTYTVTFNANGGTPAPGPQTTLAYITEPMVLKNGYVLAGWYKDAAFTQAWNFMDEYVRANVTLYAKWVKTENTAAVSGTVTDESGAPVDEAYVFLKRGDVIYNTYMTASDGTFSFIGVPAGEYQLVVTDGTNFTTTLVTVASNGTVTGGGEIKLYTTSKTSSTVEITGKGTPDVMVGGLAAVALANKDDGSADVTVTLVVESKTAENVNPVDKAKIETAAGSGKTLAFIDMTLLKTVGAAAPTPIHDTEGTLLEVVIPYDLSGKSNIALYRQHGDANAVKLPEGAANAVGGEYVTIDKANNRIRAHLRCFSTYAIGYTVSSPLPPVGPTGGGSVNLSGLAQLIAVQNQLVLTVGEKKAMAFGKEVANDVAPIIRNNRTMLPARFVAENLGAKVEWDVANRVVTITRDDVTIVLTIGSDKATVNGKEVTLDSPAFIENNRTYTPIRFVAEALGATVEWDETARQVTITKQ